MTTDTDSLAGWITTAAASKQLRVTQRRIRQLIDEGKLRGQKIADRWLVTQDSVDQYQQEKEAE